MYWNSLFCKALKNIGCNSFYIKKELNLVLPMKIFSQNLKKNHYRFVILECLNWHQNTSNLTNLYTKSTLS